MRAYNKKGNPFQRGKTWTFIYYVQNADGTRTQKWKGGYKTKRDAESDLKIYQAKAALQQTIPASMLTLKDYLPQWFESHKKMLAPNTINGYAVNINNHIIPQIGTLKLKDIKPKHLEAFYSTLMTDKELSAKTVKYIHNVLKVALKAAVDNKIIDDNPCLKAKTPKVPKFQSQLLSLEQLKTLLSEIEGDRYETEIKLAAMLGLRKGEVLGIKRIDLDTTKHTLHIQRQVSIVRDNTIDKNGLYYGIKPLKSESSDRVLFLSQEIESLILRKDEFNRGRKKILQGAYQDNNLICCNDDGTVMSPQTLYHAFKRILTRCGLPNVRFHDLRHSYATLCIDLNIPLKVISQNLGHSSTAVTDAVYADSIKAKMTVSDIITQKLTC